jgi:hypothetical protein
MIPEIVQTAIRETVTLICNGQFGAAVQRCATSRLSESDIQTVIDDYGRTLVRPPIDADQYDDVVAIEGHPVSKWSVRTPLWTLEEGRSDLTLELTITRGADSLSVELDDLGVL